jgi:hypothetical protein
MGTRPWPLYALGESPLPTGQEAGRPTPRVYRVGSGKLLLGLASTVILGSDSRGTHDHILLSHGSETRGPVGMLDQESIYARTLTHPTHFDPENRGSMYLRNVGHTGQRLESRFNNERLLSMWSPLLHVSVCYGSLHLFGVTSPLWRVLHDVSLPCAIYLYEADILFCPW